MQADSYKVIIIAIAAFVSDLDKNFIFHIPVGNIHGHILFDMQTFSDFIHNLGDMRPLEELIG